MSLIFSNFGWGCLQQFGLKGSTILLYFILAKLLGPEYLGIMAFALAILAIAEIFVVRGIAESIIQADSIENDQIGAILTKILIWAFVAFLLLEVACATLYFLNYNQDLQIVISSVAFVLFLRPLVTLQTALARRKFKFKEIAQVTFFATVIADSIAIILAVNGFNIWALVISIYIKFIILNICLLKINKIRIRLIRSSKNIQGLVSYSNEVFKTKFLSYVVLRADELIVGAFIGMYELGIYSLMVKIFRIIEDSIMVPFYNVMLATFSKVKKVSAEGIQILFSATNLLSCITIPWFIALGFFGDDIVSHILGQSWSRGSAAFIFLALYMSFRTFNYLFSAYMISNGFARYVSYSTMIYLVMTFLILLPMAKFGIIGVAVGIFSRTFLGLFVSLFFINKLKDFSLIMYLQKINIILASIPLAFALHSNNVLKSSIKEPLLLIASVVLYYVLLIIVARGKIIQDFKKVRNWNYEI